MTNITAINAPATIPMIIAVRSSASLLTRLVFLPLGLDGVYVGVYGGG